MRMGAIFYHLELIVNPIGRSLVCQISFRNNLEIQCHPIYNRLNIIWFDVILLLSKTATVRSPYVTLCASWRVRAWSEILLRCNVILCDTAFLDVTSEVLSDWMCSCISRKEQKHLVHTWLYVRPDVFVCDMAYQEICHWREPASLKKSNATFFLSIICVSPDSIVHDMLSRSSHMMFDVQITHHVRSSQETHRWSRSSHMMFDVQKRLTSYVMSVILHFWKTVIQYLIRIWLYVCPDSILHDMFFWRLNVTCD